MVWKERTDRTGEGRVETSGTRDCATARVSLRSRAHGAPPCRRSGSFHRTQPRSALRRKTTPCRSACSLRASSYGASFERSSSASRPLKVTINTIVSRIKTARHVFRFEDGCALGLSQRNAWHLGQISAPSNTSCPQSWQRPVRGAENRSTSSSLGSSSRSSSSGLLGVMDYYVIIVILPHRRQSK